MRVNDFVKSALSNELICIVKEPLMVHWEKENIVEAPQAAFRMIDGKYAEREIDRFTTVPRSVCGERGAGSVIAVSLR